ncbi:hypothetical protein QJS66_09080 [Kocuria rhizophila]|nr:hypothetical protein QJS66_09080 [Kocuria rhizophila]
MELGSTSSYSADTSLGAYNASYTTPAPDAMASGSGVSTQSVTPQALWAMPTPASVARTCGAARASRPGTALASPSRSMPRTGPAFPTSRAQFAAGTATSTPQPGDWSPRTAARTWASALATVR